MAKICYGGKMLFKAFSALLTACILQGQHMPNPSPIFSCMWKADLVFLLDGSITSNFVNFELAKNITVDIIQRIGVNPTDGFVVGLIMFDTGIRQTIALDPTLETKDPLINQIRTLPFTSIVTRVDTHLAISSLQSIFLHHGRDMLSKIVVLITDSAMTQPIDAARAADDLRGAFSVRFITLGIGPLATFQQLYSLTHDNKFILQVVGRPPPDQMHRIVDTLIDRICTFDNPCIGGGEAVIEDMMKLPHPHDCAKYISCSLPPGASLGAIPLYRADTCLFGQFWDSAAASCLPAAEATYPCMDKTRKSYAVSGLCNVFWVCTAGKTNGFACCPSGYRFDGKSHSCVSDTHCFSTCPTKPLWVVSLEGPTTPVPITRAPSTEATIPPDVASFGSATLFVPKSQATDPMNVISTISIFPSNNRPSVVAINAPTTTPAPTTVAPTTLAPVTQASTVAMQNQYGSNYRINKSINRPQQHVNHSTYNTYQRQYYPYNQQQQYYRNNHYYPPHYNPNNQYYHYPRQPNINYNLIQQSTMPLLTSTESTTPRDVTPANQATRRFQLSVRANPRYHDTLSKPTANIKRLVSTPVPSQAPLQKKTYMIPRQRGFVPRLHKEQQPTTNNYPNYPVPQNYHYNQYNRQPFPPYNHFNSQPDYRYYNRNPYQNNIKPPLNRQDGSYVIGDAVVTINNRDTKNKVPQISNLRDATPGNPPRGHYNPGPISPDSHYAPHAGSMQGHTGYMHPGPMHGQTGYYGGPPPQHYRSHHNYNRAPPMYQRPYAPQGWQPPQPQYGEYPQGLRNQQQNTVSVNPTTQTPGRKKRFVILSNEFTQNNVKLMGKTPNDFIKYKQVNKRKQIPTRKNIIKSKLISPTSSFVLAIQILRNSKSHHIHKNIRLPYIRNHTLNLKSLNENRTSNSTKLFLIHRVPENRTIWASACTLRHSYLLLVTPIVYTIINV